MARTTRNPRAFWPNVRSPLPPQVRHVGDPQRNDAQDADYREDQHDRERDHDHAIDQDARNADPEACVPGRHRVDRRVAAEAGQPAVGGGRPARLSTGRLGPSPAARPEAGGQPALRCGRPACSAGGGQPDGAGAPSGAGGPRADRAGSANRCSCHLLPRAGATVCGRSVRRPTATWYSRLESEGRRPGDLRPLRKRERPRGAVRGREVMAFGTAYRIRTDDLSLERAVSWASRRMRRDGGPPCGGPGGMISGRRRARHGRFAQAGVDVPAPPSLTAPRARAGATPGTRERLRPPAGSSARR